MGYSTEFTGSVQIDPPLNAHEREYLENFRRTRHMNRSKGEYFLDDGSGDESDVIHRNDPPHSQPSLWCCWRAHEDGGCIEWDGMDKFYHASGWMQYIIDHFLKEGALANSSGDPQFERFGPHVCNGTIYARGEDPGDIWLIVVKKNVVTKQLWVAAGH